MKKQKLQRAFTLIELLVVLAVIALLTAVVLPSLFRARLQAKVLTVNADLRQLGLALECYAMEHKKYPPTREDCNTGTLGDHLFQLPIELSRGGFLPEAGAMDVRSTVMEDRFHPGYTYKYRAVGECIRDRDIISPWIRSRLWVPDGFPASTSAASQDGQWYAEPDKSPVSWVVFSLGPNFDEERLREAASNRYPVPAQTWYRQSEKRGLIVRLRGRNGQEYGSFEGTP
jgi:prepilin-type N-terminal cleavage/methylation domain-containing protein